MSECRQFSFKLDTELADKVDNLKQISFNGNRNALLVKAVSDLVEAYEGHNTRERASPAPKIAEAVLLAQYIRDVLLQGTGYDEIVRKEVDNLCHLLS